MSLVAEEKVEIPDVAEDTRRLSSFEALGLQIYGTFKSMGVASGSSDEEIQARAEFRAAGRPLLAQVEAVNLIAMADAFHAYAEQAMSQAILGSVVDAGLAGGNLFGQIEGANTAASVDARIARQCLLEHLCNQAWPLVYKLDEAWQFIPDTQDEDRERCEGIRRRVLEAAAGFTNHLLSVDRKRTLQGANLSEKLSLFIVHG